MDAAAGEVAAGNLNVRLRLENLAQDGEARRDEEREGALDELERLIALVEGLLTLARVDRAASAPAEVGDENAAAARADAHALFPAADAILS